ncbi:hypothetical protein MLD38_033951 [Melastoma candidum]|uniref:Uncharacterized protein n=1 Tax=Melastoma candidum TaxID=119954 RepID=A0ACB9M827_9MYRT|nr:hypothetical protein MLD38_033951 [Melastoma candidum]
MNMDGRGGGDQLVVEEEEEEGSGISSCPSFNCYSSRRILPLEGASQLKVSDDNDFEFVPPIGDHAGRDDGFVIDSDWIGPVFPLFNRDLLLEKGAGGGGESRSHSIMIPLRDLFREEGNQHSSSSEEADDDLEGIPEGTYCVWTPKGTGGQPGECRKSNSMGLRSSRRWRFLDLVRRSNSDRKDSFVFLSPSESPSVTAKSGTTAVGASGSGMEERKKVVVKEGEKRGNLPYRKDAVGFWANVNNFGRTFPPFG